MTSIKRTDSADADFQSLVKLLDEELRIRDGSENAFYAQFNKIDMLKNAVVLYMYGKPVACGAFKPFGKGAVEIKRMYVLPEYRGRNIAGQILRELEDWAGELQYSGCVLETGKRQPEAIRLYEKSGYERIPNYGQYANVENSVCMSKNLNNEIR
ncbi:MAG: GNAT family N-acetyltransferase [Chitinophagaceae bacterium]|nr:GNAT family N-acetyltransferase [Chitinophagaceae bacterium]